MSIALTYIKPEYHNQFMQETRLLLKDYSTCSNFEDLKWYFDKVHKNRADDKAKYTIYFYDVPSKYMEIVKCFAIYDDVAISTRHHHVYYLNYFFKFIESIGVKELIEVDRKILNKYEEYMRKDFKCKNLTKSVKYYAVFKFFELMKSLPMMPSINPAKSINPFKNKHVVKISGKMVPDNVLAQYDKAMRDEKVPLELRVIYWILRTIPNRISEVLSMQCNCLKPLYSHYNLRINTWKQNGGYLTPEVKMIPIKYEKHGKYLIDLIKQQQEMVKSMDVLYRDINLKNALFLTKNYIFTKNYPIESMEEYRRKLFKGKQVSIYSEAKFARQIKEVVEMFDIRDKSGNLYYLKSHQLRHVNITKRMYENYSAEQVSMLSGHKTHTMLTIYKHSIPEKHKEIVEKIHDKENPLVNKQFSFRGKITNLDEKTIKILTANPRAYTMGRVNGKKGVGICSNIVGCMQKFECLECDFFIPKAEFINDYKAEHHYWEKQLEVFKKINKLAEIEKAEYNIKLLERIIAICQKGIEEHIQHINKKLKDGKVDFDTPNKGGAVDAGAIKK